MGDSEKFRLDKWLWAARFYKTRALAVQAVEGGKVHVDGYRAKSSKALHVGMLLRITRGDEVMEVTIRALSLQRRGAPEAALLYEETAESVQQRTTAAELRKLDYGVRDRGEGRPTKRQRREISRFFGDR